MSNLICKNTMRACQTPGMCAPHGGCKPAAGQLVHPDDHAKLRSDYAALEAENARLQEDNARLTETLERWLDLDKARSAERDAALAQLAAIQQAKGEADLTGEYHADVNALLSRLSAMAAEVERLNDSVIFLGGELARIKEDRDALRAELAAVKAEGAPLYSCRGKGGSYALLGQAKPAGAIKVIQGESGLAVYRDTDTGQLYFRDPQDFKQRMAPIGKIEPCSLGGDLISQEDVPLYALPPASPDVEGLVKALEEAITDIEDWAAYASPYFQEKHDLAGCLEKHRAALSTWRKGQGKP